MAERGQVVPLPKSVLDDEQAKWQDVFVIERLRETAWGEERMAVPFGSPVLICYCRTDILQKLGRQPPRTWAEYGRLAELLSDRKNLGDLSPAADKPWHGAIEPRPLPAYTCMADNLDTGPMSNIEKPGNASSGA